MNDIEIPDKDIRMLPLAQIELNEGQLEGLPQNPRSIEDGKYAKLKDNIGKYPELLKWRSLLVYPLDNGKYIIVGGNMRYRAMQELGHSEAPVFVIPKSTPVERLKAYTILDNNGFGEWDWNLLAEWPEDLLDSWGLDCDFLMQNFDYINDINEGELRNKVNTERTEFSVSFTFPMENKSALEEYIKLNCKQRLIDLIISEVCQGAEVK